MPLIMFVSCSFNTYINLPKKKEFYWGVQWQKEGDSLARYLVRIGEMTESVKIIQQALEGIPGSEKVTKEGLFCLVSPCKRAGKG